MKPTLSFEFKTLIHPHAARLLEQAVKIFDVCIVDNRSISYAFRRQMRKWTLCYLDGKKYKIRFPRIPPKKGIYIDDISFSSNLDELLRYKIENKKMSHM